MQDFEQRPRLSAGRAGAAASGLLGRLATLAAGAVLLVAAVMFSVLVLAIAAAVALLISGYLWWKTRELRRRMRENPPGGRVIEGEVIRRDGSP
ncbi:MAG TPA: hypothetical protein VNM24_07870 [Burkholderiales bacterium]|jgi:O-antigen/teichoic acid export membrane protein|nr:hypothetical protein [Burkholderiales bacterium]